MYEYEKIVDLRARASRGAGPSKRPNAEPVTECCQHLEVAISLLGGTPQGQITATMVRHMSTSV
eukprot:scaffold400556_cov29-Prasinocladus_malaysianus.AAC.1